MVVIIIDGMHIRRVITSIQNKLQYSHRQTDSYIEVSVHLIHYKLEISIILQPISVKHKPVHIMTVITPHNVTHTHSKNELNYQNLTNILSHVGQPDVNDWLSNM